MVTGIRGPDQPNDGLFHPLEHRVARQELACDRLVAASLGLPEGIWFRESGTYHQAWEQLSPSQRRDLEARFGEPALREILSLGGEPSLNNLAESLFNLGQRLENTDHLAAASVLFSTLISLPPELPIRDRAQHRLDAILGRGDAAARSEFLFRRTMDQASDLSSLLAMTIAGGVFQRVRLGLSCGLAAQSANLLTRGLGARFVATAGALLTEAPAFAISGAAAQQLLHPESSAEEPLGRATWSAFFTLVGLRTMGGLSGLALQRSGAGNGLGQGVLRTVLPQVGMFSGIVLGRQLETYAGLRPQSSRDTLLTDSLATLVQFQVAGRLSQAVLGPEAQAQDRTSEILQVELNSPSASLFAPLPDFAFVRAGTEISRSRPSSEENSPLQNGLLSMMMNGRGPKNPGNGGKVVSLSEYRQSRLRSSNPPAAPGSERDDEPQPSLLHQIASASDPEYWRQQLRLGIADWYANEPIHLFQRDFRTIERRLRVAPPDFVKLLGSHAVSNPPVAKALLVNLGILPAESPLYRGIAHQLWEEARPNPQELLETGDRALERFQTASRRLTGNDSLPLTPQEQRDFRHRLSDLSRFSLEALRDPLISDSQFLFLTYYLGLQRRGYIGP